MSGGEMGLERGLHLAHDFRLGHSTDKLVDHLTAFEEKHGGNAADAEFNGKIFALINIHLDDIGFACKFFGYFIKDGRKFFARATPSGEKVYNEKAVLGCEFFEALSVYDCCHNDWNDCGYGEWLRSALLLYFCKGSNSPANSQIF